MVRENKKPSNYEELRKSKLELITTLKNLYVLNNYDVLNYQVSPENNLTYHHLIFKSELKILGFPLHPTLENGLLLTSIGHSYLHLIYDYATDIFYDLNKVIFLFTKERRLPTLEERSLMQILLEAFEYRMQDYISISEKYLNRERKLILA